MLLSQYIVGAASLVSIVHALPSSEPTGLVVLEQFTKEDGALAITVYGDADADASAKRATDSVPAALQRRCGSDSVVCDNSHLADRSACESLVNALSGDQAQLPGSPRSICGTYGGRQCCVSWNNPVTGGVRASLVDAARAILNQCQGNTGVSGKAYDTLIGHTYTEQYLSDRAKGC